MDMQLLMAALGEFPQKTALSPRVLESIDCGSYLREKVEYSTEADERVRAYLCLPKDRKKNLPAVFCHHQHDWNFSLGKSEVVGLAGDPDQRYAAELAERGYITFAPDAIGFEERNWSGGSFETSYFELATRLVTGRTLCAKILHDASVGIDYLLTRAEVDRNRIGFLGHSYGGRMAIWLPALDKRIRASVSNCGCIDYRHSLSRDTGIQMEFCIPLIAHFGDMEDIAAMAAPTPLYISATDGDRWSRGAQQLYDAAKVSFPEGSLKLKIWPGGHIFTKEMREEAYSFLDKHLRE
jgi:dienelactone hydrolase